MSNLRRVAWESYITYCSVYDDNVFDVLHQEYSYTVERLDAASREERPTDAHQNFAQHLMTLYWWGKLDLDEPNGLLMRFFELAPDMLRGYALEFVGRSLRKTDEVDLQILDRLQFLWKQRIDAAGTATLPTSHTTELAAFSWWFTSGKFDDSWAITQLKQVFELVDMVDADSLVVERLAALADVNPESAVECLSLMIEKDKSGLNIHRWHDDEIKTILAASIKSSSDTAKQRAEALINYLGERGCWQFRELLSKETNSKL